MSIKKSHLYIIVIIIITAFFIAFYLLNDPIPDAHKETKQSSYTVALKRIEKIDSLYNVGSFDLLKKELNILISKTEQWKKISDAYEFSRVFNDISDYSYRMGNVDVAKKYNILALSRYEEIENINFKSNLLNNQANIEADEGNYTKAIAISFKYAELYKDDPRSKRLIDCYNNLGVMYRDTKNYDLAIEYFKKLEEVLAANNIKKELGYYYANLGATYMEMGNTNQAISLLENAAVHFNKNKQVKDIIAVNAILASCYLEVGKVNMAEKILANNLQRSEELKIWETYVETTISLFDFYIAQNNIIKAFEYINKGLSNSHHSNQKRLKIKIYDKLIYFYADKGNYEDAFNYQEQQSVIRESLLSTTKNNTIRELTVKYETDLKNSRIEKLENLNKEEKRLKRIYLGILGVAIIVVLLISFLMNRIFVQKKAIEKSDQTKDKLFSIIAHDLRSPMIALQGTELLVKKYVERQDYDKLIKLASKIDNALYRINHLLDNLLKWSVTNGKQLTYSPEFTSIDSLINEAVSLHAMNISAKNITLETSIQSAKVFIDLQMIACVLRNIISNAVKYSPDDGIIEIKGKIEKEFYCVSVINDGPGIPDDVIKKITNNKEDIITGGDKGSFGLGLRLAFLFARKNNGFIEIKNINNGTQLKIHLPLKNTP